MANLKAPAASRWDHEVRLLAWLAVCVSVFSFLFYFRHGDVLLYGDAVAHLNIARRVFDSKTPGILQLGTVWLPLPHLLMIPFIISNEMWQHGSGGSIPSLAAYVFGVVGMYRLVRDVLSRTGETNAPAHVAAWAAAAVYGANPNLIYMQTTAMGEALYLAFFIWSVVFFGEATYGDAKALIKCGLCLAAACLTRYDGWFLAVAMSAAAIVLHFRETAGNRGAPSFPRAFSRGAIAKFVLIAATAPALWLGYNAIVYRNPLEFANGPYSAKAIEKRTASAGMAGHPGTGNLWVAGSYFLKSSEANIAEAMWLQRSWLALAAAALIVLFTGKSRRLPLLFLWIPLPFYALSVAYGGVPIFIPAWWPFSNYNVRYGLQMLPAFASAIALLVYFVFQSNFFRGRLRQAAIVAIIIFAGASYASIWRADPICYREAAINMRGRNALEQQLSNWLIAMPPNATLLMYLGDHVGALQQAGMPLKRVINEGNHRTWMQPSDPQGLWERALADPSQFADFVLAFDGDSVWKAVQGRHLKELVEINVTGQARAILYRAR